jgi:hypothetical protein
MENTNEIIIDEVPQETKRPDMLKVLCILTFIACGLELLAFSMGTILLFIDPANLGEAWDNAIQSNPKLADVDPAVLLHQFGTYCLYAVIANIFTLIGAIMMWRLDKIGLIIYTVAELALHFFTIEMPGQEGRSMGGLVFGVVIDLVFIALYFSQIKYFRKKIA